VLGYFDKDLREAQRHYRRFVEKVLGKALDNPLKDVFASTFLGSEKFIEHSKEKWIGFKNADICDGGLPAIASSGEAGGYTVN
jgi:hypothetical protein